MPSETLISQLKPRPKFSGMVYDKSFYNSTTWKRLRTIKKARNPICETEGCLNDTHTIDHIQPIRLGGAKTSMDNLKSLCKTCNARKTAKQQYER